MQRENNEVRIQLEDQKFFRFTWSKLLELYKPCDDGLKHWVDNEVEFGTFKDVEALLGFTEPFLYARTSFNRPGIEPDVLFSCLSNIYDYIENTKNAANHDYNDQFMGFDSEPYPRAKKVWVDYIDGAANVLLLSLDVLEISNFMSEKNDGGDWDLPEELKRKMTKIVESAFNVLMDSVISDQLGARWAAVSQKVGSKYKIGMETLDRYSNLVSTFYAFRALQRLTENPTLASKFRGIANRIKQIEPILSKVIFWVNSLYNKDLKSYSLTNSRDSFPMISSLYALEMIYTHHRNNRENNSEVLNNANIVLKTLLQSFQDLDEASSRFQVDVSYPYPRIEYGKVKSTESYDERRYIGAYLGIMALAKEVDPNVIEGKAEKYQKVTSELVSALRSDWIDQGYSIWDDGRPLVYFAVDAMLGLLRFYSSGKIFEITIREDILRIKLKEYLSSPGFIDGFINRLKESKGEG
jgi:hypothetical protein